MPRSKAPELIFGLVAPIGVDLDMITAVLDRTLREMGYEARRFRMTDLMREVRLDLPLAARPYVDSYRRRIAYANEVRRRLGNEALAALAISAIRTFRAEERERRKADRRGDRDRDDEPDSGEADEEAPLPGRAYIIRQLKRPQEVAVLRGVYGRQFVLVSAYAPAEARRRGI